MYRSINHLCLERRRKFARKFRRARGKGSLKEKGVLAVSKKTSMGGTAYEKIGGGIFVYKVLPPLEPVGGEVRLRLVFVLRNTSKMRNELSAGRVL